MNDVKPPGLTPFINEESKIADSLQIFHGVGNRRSKALSDAVAKEFDGADPAAL